MATWGTFRYPLRIMAFSLSLVVFLPKNLDKVDFRGVATNALAVAVDESSPALMALQDVRESFPQPETEFSIHALNLASSRITVQAGVDSQEIRSQILETKPIQLLPNLQPSAVTSADEDVLVGLKIGVPPQEAPITKNLESVISDVGSVAIFADNGELKPLVERKQELLATVAQLNLEIPTVSQKAQRLIAQEAQNQQESRISRVIQTQSGSQIYVAKTDIGQQTNNDDSVKSRSSARQLATETEAPVTLSSVEWQDHHNRPLVISGQLRMQNGLAYTGDDISISITRVVNGESAEAGKIWLRDARYEIFVREAKGFLVTEVHNKSGLLLAYDEYDLNQLPNPGSHQNQVAGVDINLSPIQQGAIVHVVSGYSYENKLIPLENAEVTIEPFGNSLQRDIDGRFVEHTLAPGSNILTRVTSPNHWPTLTRVVSGAAATVRVFHEGMIKALIDIVSNEWARDENHKKGVIWGLVTENGRPVAGATVEISGDVAEVAYLNSIYLPDVALKKTTSNGMFAAVGASEGLQTVRVVYGNKVYPAQVVMTENKTVSYIEIDFGVLQTTQIRVVDAFNEAIPLEASVRTLDSDVIIEGVFNNQDIKTVKSQFGFHFFEVDAGPQYEMLRVEEPLRQSFVQFPMIPTDWLQQKKAQAKVSDRMDVGTIVGWVETGGFEVILNDGENVQDIKILYFNGSGERVPDSSSAAGFVLFHVPLGQQTVTILPSQSKNVVTKIVHVEPSFVSSIISETK